MPETTLVAVVSAGFTRLGGPRVAARLKIVAAAVASYSGLPEPMLARSGRLPTSGDYAYELKWEGGANLQGSVAVVVLSTALVRKKIH
jgi:hypothetical protein